MSGTGSIDVGGQLRTPAGYSLPATTALPTPTGGIHHAAPDLFTRMGDAVQHDLPLIAGGSLLAGIGAGAKLAHGSIWRGLGIGFAASIGSGAALLGATMGVRALTGNGPDSGSATTGAPLPSAHDAVFGSQHVRVMTFNLHGGQGVYGDLQPTQATVDRLAADIAREHPDIVLLQESDHLATRSLYHDDLTLLSHKLGATGAVAGAPVVNVTGRAQEVGVLTFNGFTIDNARNVQVGGLLGAGLGHRARAWVNAVAHNDITKSLNIPEFDPVTFAQFEPRNVVDTVVHAPDGSTMRVLTGHLSWGSSVDPTLQQRQLSMLADDVAAWKGPTIYGGDFNTASAHANYQQEVDALDSAGMTDAFTTLGIGPADQRRASSSTGTGIDRIYTSAQWQVDGIHTEPTHTTSSDHDAVIADLTLPASS